MIKTARARVQRLAFEPLELGLARIEGTAGFVVTLGLGSALARRKTDPAGVFWGLADRGPNVKPGDAGPNFVHLLEVDGAKILPRPDLGPTLARLRLAGSRVGLEAMVRLRAPDGSLLSGLPPPGGSDVEPGFDAIGRPLALDPDGLDPEGLVCLPDGGFAIAEEYGPSIVFVDEQGIARARWIPKGLRARFAGAKVPLVECLPAIAVRRRKNRGFEGLALSPDGKSLIGVFQSALAGNKGESTKRAPWVRIWQMALSDAALEGQWLYRFDPPASWEVSEGEEVGWNDLKVCDVAVRPGRRTGAGQAGTRLVVLERISRTTRLYEVRLDPALRTPDWTLDPDHAPSLEAAGHAGDGVVASLPELDKVLVFDSHQLPLDELPLAPDQEGLIMLDANTALMSTDDDWGSGGARTVLSRVRLAR